MGLETAAFVSDFDTSNPASGDLRSQGDDHFRMMKTALKATFPGASKAFYFPNTSVVSSNTNVLAADEGKTFFASTTSGSVTFTLPTLASGDAGWTCRFIKYTFDTNPMFIVPASGFVISGEVPNLTRARRCIPGHASTLVWSGGGWYLTRAVSMPVGSCIEFHGTSLPVGYEWPTGQTLASASTNYPEYNAVIGSGVTLDRQDRVAAMRDITGVNRLTSIINGDTFGTAGGADINTLVTANLPAYTPTGTIVSNVTDPGHIHALLYSVAVQSGSNTFCVVHPLGSGAQSGNVSSSTTGITVASTFTGAAQGGASAAFSNVQPTIVCNFILVVE